MPNGNGNGGRLARAVKYAECRPGALGHAWDTYGPEPGWSLSLLCARCASRRLDDIDAGGVVIARRYYYPDDYKLRKEDKPATTDLRLELMRRVRENGTTRLRGRRDVRMLFTDETVSG